MHKGLKAERLQRKVALLLVLALTACGPRATPTLSPTSPPTLQPTPTQVPTFPLGNWHEMFYHKPSGRIMLVNGGPENGKPATDPIELWTWNGSEWSIFSVDPDGPRWRNFASITYDSKREALILYGGLTAEQDYTDTWEWNGESWTRFTVEGPGPREGAGMTYDGTREKVILFGGAQRGRMMNDTWEWNGVQWTQVSNEGPGARFPAGFAYDAAHQNVILFGGHAFDGQAFTTFGDTWAWNGTTWRQTTSDGPSPRDGARAVFVPTSNQILLFGGAEIDTSVTNLNDTWTWDGARWVQADVFGPPPRVHAAMAFDESRRVVVMTGGSNGPNTTLTDTWEWDGEIWTCADGCQ